MHAAYEIIESTLSDASEQVHCNCIFEDVVQGDDVGELALG